VTNTTKRILFFQKFSAFTAIAKALGINFIVTTFHRTAEAQEERFNRGKSQCDGYDKKSKHQSWLAIDIAIVENGNCIWDRTKDYEQLGKIWVDIFNGIWGGNWESLNDIYHFQYGG